MLCKIIIKISLLMFIVGITQSGKVKKLIKGSFHSREVVWELRDVFYKGRKKCAI